VRLEDAIAPLHATQIYNTILVQIKEYLKFWEYSSLQRARTSTLTIVHFQGTMAMKEAISNINSSRSIRKVNKNIRP
jgi:hypothetical protein